jgi:hypothetical protein
MAYSFGGGVRPELGKTDYSGYLQGALTGAQGVAAGGSAIGQGIANAGQQIGTAVKEYYIKKEKKQLSNQANTLITGMIKKYPKQAQNLFGIQIGADGNPDPGAVKSIVDSLTPAGAMGLFQNLNKEEEAKDLATQAARATRIFEGYGSMDAPADLPNGFDPRALQAGSNQALSNQKTRSEIADLKAQARTRGIPKPSDMGDYLKLKEIELGRTATAGEKASWMQEFRRDAAGNVNVDVGSNKESQETAKFKVERNIKLLSSAEEGMNTMRKTKELADVINSGDANLGIFSKLNQAKDKFISAFGGADAMKRASTTQIAEALMGSEVFQLFQQLGVGARGLDTPAEREFMMKVLTGDVTMQKEAILAMAKSRFDDAKRSVETFNGRVKDSEGYRNWVKDFNYGIPQYEALDWGASGAPIPAARTWNPSTGKFE